MQELVLASEHAALKRLVRGNLVGVVTPNETEEKSHERAIGGPFWYYKGKVVHHHRDNTLTVRFEDCREMLPQTLRFDTTFYAKRSCGIPLMVEEYALLPWTGAIERQIKLQRLKWLCWNMGSMSWSHLSEQELDEALALAGASFARFLDYSKMPLEPILGTLATVLGVYHQAALVVGRWRYEITITNRAEGSGRVRIHSAQRPLDEPWKMPPPVDERLFSSHAERLRLLAEIGGVFPAVPADALWSSAKYPR